MSSPGPPKALTSHISNEQILLGILSLWWGVYSSNLCSFYILLTLSSSPHLLIFLKELGQVMHLPSDLTRTLEVSNSYLHGAVDLGAVKHEREVVKAGQGSLPGHVFCFFVEEEGVV